MRFVDEVSLSVRGGDGGNGAVAFRRERFRPRGGPSGGDGGRGGDVVLAADEGLHTLLDLRYRPRLEADRGEDGGGRDRHGRGADPLEVRVPVGTLVLDDADGSVIGDMVENGQRLVVAAGGRGGRGNMRFATSSNRAPGTAEPGERGESREIRLELRLLADVGLVGMPNVGKSTIISRLSAARPKVAGYPFTTLAPNLGVVETGPGESFVAADIPGLVPGAARGAGLGARFLRHVQRSAAIALVVAPDESGERDPSEDVEALIAEMGEFDPDLARRPRLVVLNKMDLPEARMAEPAIREALAGRGLELVACSAATGEGLGELRRAMARALEDREGEPP